MCNHLLAKTTNGDHFDLIGRCGRSFASTPWGLVNIHKCAKSLYPVHKQRSKSICLGILNTMVWLTPNGGSIDMEVHAWAIRLLCWSPQYSEKIPEDAKNNKYKDRINRRSKMDLDKVFARPFVNLR